MVHFVGAGSGALDLITLKGDRLLREADVVIYAGSLVNPELLSVCRRDCALHNSAHMTLEQVLDVTVQAERDQKMTVRLHTGDPSIYGAIHEQMAELRKLEIPFEVVPGVSSFCGAAAALEAEFTLPGVSQSVIITRMEGRTPVPELENMASMASHGASMVIFLSTGLLEELQAELVKGAYTADTKAAIVYKATWPDELVLRCTVGTLAETARAHNIQRTALIMVGDFLGEEYERSKLYDPKFTTLFRKGEDQ